MAFDSPPGSGPTPAFIRLYVEDAEAVHRRAVEAGGTSVAEVTHLFFGDEVGRVRDPFGNLWWIQTHIEDVDEEEMGRRMTDPGSPVPWSTSRERCTTRSRRSRPLLRADGRQQSNRSPTPLRTSSTGTEKSLVTRPKASPTA